MPNLWKKCDNLFWNKNLVIVVPQYDTVYYMFIEFNSDIYL